MVIDVAQQDAVCSLMNNQPDIFTNAHRAEIRVSWLVEFVELQTGMRRIELEIERCRLDGPLLVARQSSEAIGKCIGNPEFHITPPSSRKPLHRTVRGCP